MPTRGSLSAPASLWPWRGQIASQPTVTFDWAVILVHAAWGDVTETLQAHNHAQRRDWGGSRSRNCTHGMS